MENDRFYSGISGVALPYSKLQYPPEYKDKTRLQFYASLFNSVEVNSIFYKLPRASTIANWRDSVPQNFRFTFKVSKSITHVKSLKFKREDVVAFLQTVAHAGDKKGCLLAQFPPSLKIDSLNEFQNLAEALCETAGVEWKIAVEFRNASWYEREVFEVLNDYQLTMVIHDNGVSATPLTPVIGDFIYLRFHGPEPRYRGDYSDQYLHHYAELVKEWLNEGKTVYSYFNNTMGIAVKNLQTFSTMVNNLNN